MNILLEINACLDPDKARLINMSSCVFNLSLLNNNNKKKHFIFHLKNVCKVI